MSAQISRKLRKNSEIHHTILLYMTQVEKAVEIELEQF